MAGAGAAAGVDVAGTAVAVVTGLTSAGAAGMAGAGDTAGTGTVDAEVDAAGAVLTDTGAAGACALVGRSLRPPRSKSGGLTSITRGARSGY